MKKTKANAAGAVATVALPGVGTVKLTGDALVGVDVDVQAAKDALKLPDYHAAVLPKERDVTEVMRWLVEKNLVKQEYGYKELVKEDCLP